MSHSDLKDHISKEHYFTAQDGMYGALSKTKEACPDGTDNKLNLITFCVLITKTGVVLTGASVAESYSDFDREYAKKVAKDVAVSKLYTLHDMGLYGGFGEAHA